MPAFANDSFRAGRRRATFAVFEIERHSRSNTWNEQTYMLFGQDRTDVDPQHNRRAGYALLHIQL